MLLNKKQKRKQFVLLFPFSFCFKGFSMTFSRQRVSHVVWEKREKIMRKRTHNQFLSCNFRILFLRANISAKVKDLKSHWFFSRCCWDYFCCVFIIFYSIWRIQKLLLKVKGSMWQRKETRSVLCWVFVEKSKNIKVSKDS